MPTTSCAALGVQFYVLPIIIIISLRASYTVVFFCGLTGPVTVSVIDFLYLFNLGSCLLLALGHRPPEGASMPKMRDQFYNQSTLKQVTRD